MINFNDSFIEDWNKKVVYAPNGFGKTTCANKLYEKLLNKGEKVEIFTRRKLENLVSTYKNKIFIGKTSTLAKQNNQLLDSRYNSKTYSLLKQCIQSDFGVTSAAKAKSSSLFFTAIRLANTYDLQRFIEHVDDAIGAFREITITISENDRHLIDSYFDYYSYRNLIFYCEKRSEIKRKKIKIGKYSITQETLDILNSLNEIVIDDSAIRYCPLCGKVFRSHDNLVAAINKQLNKYNVESKQHMLLEIKEFLNQIHNVAKVNKIEVINNLFEGIDDTLVSDLYIVLHQLFDLFKQSLVMTFKKIKSYTDGKNKIGDDIETFVKNKNTIELERTKTNKNKKISKNIQNVFTDIAYLPSNVELRHDNDALTFKLYIDGVEKENIYDYLSESELKRLSLSILKAFVTSGIIDYLILDDPIDSYDDYYVTLACNAIKEIARCKKLSGWYITTNNFNLLFYLSEYNFKFKIFNENPDTVFNGADKNIPIEIDASSREIYCLNSNELSIIKDMVRGVERKHKTVPLDCDLSFLTFAITLRNFRDLIIDGYGNIRIKCYKNSFFKKDVSSVIEHCFMHYDFIPNKDGKTSLNVTNQDLFNIYRTIFSINEEKDINKFKNDSTSLTNFREIVAKQSWSTRSGSKILALIFSKIVMMSYLKFHIEELMISRLKTFGFNDGQLSLITNCNDGLLAKIQTIKEVNKIANISNVANFVISLNNLHNKFHHLFNSFDHALDQLFPPYLATSMLDIKRLKDEIDKL